MKEKETFSYYFDLMTKKGVQRNCVVQAGVEEEPDRSKHQQQQHDSTTPEVVSHRMNETCVYIALHNFLFLSRDPFHYTGRIFFPPFLFVLNKIYLFYRFMAALVCFISMAI